MDDQSNLTKRIDTLKKTVTHCSVVNSVLALQYILLAFFSLVFNYENKTHLIIFGVISSVQLVSAPLGFNAVESENRLHLMVLALISIIWIISALFMLIIYCFISPTDSFGNEIALHVGALIFLGASIVLSVTTFMLMRSLDMIRVNVIPPNIENSGKRKSPKK